MRDRVARLAGDRRCERAARECHRRRVVRERGKRGRAPLHVRRDAGLGRVIAEGQQHARERNPIDDAVLDPPDDRGAIAEAVDEVRVPQRLVAIEGSGLQRRHERLERGLVTGGGQPVAVHVSPQVEAGIVLPPRQAERNEGLHGPLAEAREAIDQPFAQQRFNRLPVRRSRKPHDARDDREVARTIHAQPGRVDGAHVAHQYAPRSS